MKRTKAIVALVFALSASTVLFQNCGQMKSSSSSSNASVKSSAASCLFNGQTIQSGDAAPSFSVSSVPFGQSCDAVKISVTCENGNLNPITAAATCAVLPGASCAFNGKSIASGETVKAYQTASVPSGSICASQTRTCTNGTLDGAYGFASCDVNAPLNCSFNGNVILNGATTQGYPSAIVPYGQVCTAQTITCTNAVLNPANYVASCSVQPGAACNFNGKTLASGGTTQGYPSATVPFGQTCNAETITCTNGVLSPANDVGACSVDSPHAWGQLGLGEPVADNVFTNSWDINIQLDKIINLKPKVFRLWVTGGWFIDASGNTIPANLAVFKTAVSRLTAAGIPIIGMQHYFPGWMTGADETVLVNNQQVNWNTIPCVSVASQYSAFLDKYEQNWQKMAQLFPEIAMWEPANETNAVGAIKPIQAGAGSCGKATFTHDERVFITVQLMERAHRALKSVNSKTVVFMPPPAPQNDELQLTGPFGTNDVKLVTIKRFIDDLYKKIASLNGNPRSYFDGIAWHPYIFMDADQNTWVAANQAIYDMINSHGDGNIPIIFSEIGNSNFNYIPGNAATGYVPASGTLGPVSDSVLNGWMQNYIRLSQGQLPWLTYIVWFRAFNDPSALSWGGQAEVQFGIMNSDYPTFTKKPSTDTFCKFSGCISEPIRAYIDGVGFAAFWLNLEGGQYCQYKSPADFTALLGADYASTLPYLAAIDPAGKTFVGYCKAP